MTPKTKKFSELAGPLYADPDSRLRIAAHKAAMLAELREALDTTQAQLAGLLDVSQENVSRIERERDVRLSTLRRYVEALGGRLEVRAVFDDGSVELVAPGEDQGQPERRKRSAAASRGRRAPTRSRP
jgi:transcriptional regulator with XRE-family HTH domain